MNIAIKVNNSKLRDISTLQRQIRRVFNRLLRYNPSKPAYIELFFATNGDDFRCDRCTLLIKAIYEKI